MGINDEYSRDAYYEYNAVADQDDDQDDFDLELHPEDWQDMYSKELLDGWMHLRQYVDENYMKITVGFPDFVSFVLAPHLWYTEEQPGMWQQCIWNDISKIAVITDRVCPENFYAWVNNYVEYI